MAFKTIEELRLEEEERKKLQDQIDGQDHKDPDENSLDSLLKELGYESDDLQTSSDSLLELHGAGVIVDPLAVESQVPDDLTDEEREEDVSFVSETVELPSELTETSDYVPDAIARDEAGMTLAPTSDKYLDLLGERQGLMTQLGRGANTLAVGFATGVVDYLASYDLKNVSDMWTGEEREFGNSWTKWSDEWRKESGKENVIYGGETFNPSSRGWWVSTVASSGYSLGIAAIALGENYAVTNLTATLGTGFSLASTATKVNKLKKLYDAVKITDAARKAKLIADARKTFVIGSGITMGAQAGVREAWMNGVSNYYEVYEEMERKHPDKTHEEKVQIAANAASMGFSREWKASAILNAIQVVGFTKFNARTNSMVDINIIDKLGLSRVADKTPGWLKKTMGFGWDMSTEGFEEGWQFLAAEEGKREAYIKHGLQEDDGSTFLGSRLGEYVKTDEFKNNVAGGMVGGGVFRGLKYGYNRFTGSVDRSDGDKFKNKVMGTLGREINAVYSTESKNERSDAREAALSTNQRAILSAIQLDEANGSNSSVESMMGLYDSIEKTLSSGDEASIAAMRKTYSIDESVSNKDLGELASKMKKDANSIMKFRDKHILHSDYRLANYLAMVEFQGQEYADKHDAVSSEIDGIRKEAGISDAAHTEQMISAYKALHDNELTYKGLSVTDAVNKRKSLKAEIVRLEGIHSKNKSDGVEFGSFAVDESYTQALVKKAHYQASRDMNQRELEVSSKPKALDEMLNKSRRSRNKHNKKVKKTSEEYRDNAVDLRNEMLEVSRELSNLKREYSDDNDPKIKSKIAKLTDRHDVLRDSEEYLSKKKNDHEKSEEKIAKENDAAELAAFNANNIDDDAAAKGKKLPSAIKADHELEVAKQAEAAAKKAQDAANESEEAINKEKGDTGKPKDPPVDDPKDPPKDVPKDVPVGKKDFNDDSLDFDTIVDVEKGDSDYIGAVRAVVEFIATRTHAKDFKEIVEMYYSPMANNGSPDAAIIRKLADGYEDYTGDKKGITDAYIQGLIDSMNDRAAKISSPSRNPHKPNATKPPALSDGDLSGDSRGFTINYDPNNGKVDNNHPSLDKPINDVKVTFEVSANQNKSGQLNRSYDLKNSEGDVVGSLETHDDVKYIPGMQDDSGAYSIALANETLANLKLDLAKSSKTKRRKIKNKIKVLEGAMQLMKLRTLLSIAPEAVTATMYLRDVIFSLERSIDNAHTQTLIESNSTIIYRDKDTDGYHTFGGKPVDMPIHNSSYDFSSDDVLELRSHRGGAIVAGFRSLTPIDPDQQVTVMNILNHYLTGSLFTVDQHGHQTGSKNGRSSRSGFGATIDELRKHVAVESLHLPVAVKKMLYTLPDDEMSSVLGNEAVKASRDGTMDASGNPIAPKHKERISIYRSEIGGNSLILVDRDPVKGDSSYVISPTVDGGFRIKHIFKAASNLTVTDVTEDLSPEGFTQKLVDLSAKMIMHRPAYEHVESDIESTTVRLVSVDGEVQPPETYESYVRSRMHTNVKNNEVDGKEYSVGKEVIHVEFRADPDIISKEQDRRRKKANDDTSSVKDTVDAVETPEQLERRLAMEDMVQELLAKEQAKLDNQRKKRKDSIVKDLLERLDKDKKVGLLTNFRRHPSLAALEDLLIDHNIFILDINVRLEERDSNLKSIHGLTHTKELSPLEEISLVNHLVGKILDSDRFNESKSLENVRKELVKDMTSKIAEVEAVILSLEKLIDEFPAYTDSLETISYNLRTQVNKYTNTKDNAYSLIRVANSEIKKSSTTGYFKEADRFDSVAQDASLGSEKDHTKSSEESSMIGKVMNEFLLTLMNIKNGEVIGFGGNSMNVDPDTLNLLLLRIFKSKSTWTLDEAISKLKDEAPNHSWAAELVDKLSSADVQVQNQFLNVISQREVKMYVTHYSELGEPKVYELHTSGLARQKFKEWNAVFNLQRMDQSVFSDSKVSFSLISDGIFSQVEIPTSKKDLSFDPETKEFGLNFLNDFFLEKKMGEKIYSRTSGPNPWTRFNPSTREQVGILANVKDGTTIKFSLGSHFLEIKKTGDEYDYKLHRKGLVKKDIHALLALSGILITDETMTQLMDKGIPSLGLTGQELFSTKSGSFLDILNQSFISKSDLAFSSDKSKVISAIAFIDAIHDKKNAIKSVLDGSKSISSFANSRSVDDQVTNLQNEEYRRSLMKSVFSRNSYTLHLMGEEVFDEYFRITDTAITASLTDGVQALEESEMNDSEHLNQNIARFANYFTSKDMAKPAPYETNSFGNQMKIPLRKGAIPLPAISDSGKTLHKNTYVFDFFNIILDGLINTNSPRYVESLRALQAVIFDVFISPEINAIIENRSKTSHKYKNDAKFGSIFLFDPMANMVPSDTEGVTIVQKLNQDADNILNTQEKLRLTNFFLGRIKSEVIANSDHIKRANTKVSKSYTRKFKSIDSYGQNTYIFNENGKENADLKGVDVSSLALHLDYFINYKLQQAENFTTLLGHPKQFVKFKGLKDGQLAHNMDSEQYKALSFGLFQNFNKRSKGMISPGTPNKSKHKFYGMIEVADEHTFTQEMAVMLELQYGKTASDNYAKITDQASRRKFIDAHYPGLSSYMEMEHTDGQEYVSVLRYLDIINSEGKLPEKVYNDAVTRIEKFNKLAPDERTLDAMREAYGTDLMNIIYQNIKSVYTGTRINEGDLKSDFVKSSIFPLLPITTLGKGLDKIRDLIEKQEALLKDNKDKRFVHVSYSSANKINNAINPLKAWDGKGNPVPIDNNAIFESSRDLESSNFRIQQQNPFKLHKQGDLQISATMQLIKGLFADGLIDEDGFKGGLTGKETYDRFQKALLELNEHKVSEFKKNYFLDNDYKPVKDSFGRNHMSRMRSALALKKKLESTLETLGADMNDINMIDISFEMTISSNNGNSYPIKMNADKYEKIINRGDKSELLRLINASTSGVISGDSFGEQRKDGWAIDNFISLSNVDFNVPLHYQSFGKNYESVMNSFIKREIVDLKMPGNNFIAVSPAGFKKVSEVDYDSSVGSGFISIDGHDSANGLKSVVKDDDKGSHVYYAEVYIAPKFKDPLTGEVIDLYSKDGDGNHIYIDIDDKGALSLKPGSIDPRLLTFPSVRIPTSSHKMMTVVKVVGFLPPNQGDSIVVPAEFTIRKGLDFDIDKETAYAYNIFKNEKGHIKLVNDFRLSDMNSLQSNIDSEIDSLEFSIKRLKKNFNIQKNNLDKATRKEVLDHISNLERQFSIMYNGSRRSRSKVITLLSNIESDIANSVDPNKIANLEEYREQALDWLEKSGSIDYKELDDSTYISDVKKELSRREAAEKKALDFAEESKHHLPYSFDVFTEYDNEQATLRVREKKVKAFSVIMPIIDSVIGDLKDSGKTAVEIEAAIELKVKSQKENNVKYSIIDVNGESPNTLLDYITTVLDGESHDGFMAYAQKVNSDTIYQNNMTEYDDRIQEHKDDASRANDFEQVSFGNTTLNINIMDILSLDSDVSYTNDKGNPCAAAGMKTSFKKGGKWNVVQDLKGYPSHSEGGVDINLDKNGFSFSGGNKNIKAANGLVLPKIK